MLVDHAMAYGWDTAHGGLYHSGPFAGRPADLLKEWWVQMESLNTLLMLHERYGDQVSIIHADENLLQIMDKRVSKAVALKKVAGSYGIDPAEIMAIGDAPNDVGMLQLAGVAIAMDNAHRVVKKVADWIAPSNDDHGVHAALVRYGLCS